MSVDFFSPEYQKECPRKDVCFGIIDPEPAQTTIDADVDWIAVVHNASSKALQFVPIDHNIPLYNRKGGMSKRCDGMLFIIESDEMLCFIELKSSENNHAHWLKAAISQLKQTVLRFQKEHQEEIYSMKVAYASNGKHNPANPKMPSFISTTKQQFEDKTSYSLQITNTICVP